MRGRNRRRRGWVEKGDGSGGPTLFSLRLRIHWLFGEVVLYIYIHPRQGGVRVAYMKRRKIAEGGSDWLAQELCDWLNIFFFFFYHFTFFFLILFFNISISISCNICIYDRIIFMIVRDSLKCLACIYECIGGKKKIDCYRNFNILLKRNINELIFLILKVECAFFIFFLIVIWFLFQKFSMECWTLMFIEMEILLDCE